MAYDIIGYIALLIMGGILGLLGGGGAILTLPILVYLFGVSPVLATSYSLFVVGISSALGTIGYYRRNEVDSAKALGFFVPSAIGVLVSRKLIVPALPEIIFRTASFSVSRGSFLMMMFSVLMIIVGFNMIRTRPKPIGVEPNQATTGKRATQALGVGLLTGFVGAGGGFIIVPALTRYFGLPMKVAIGSSLLIIALNSAIGFSSDLIGENSIAWRQLLVFSAIGLVGMLIGSGLSKKLSSEQLKTLFGYFVLSMGVLIAVREAFFA